MAAIPVNFPANIPLNSIEYSNWSETIVTGQLWTAAPRDAGEVVQVCNWAKAQDPVWQVRARGICHGWPPLTIDPDTQANARLIVLDTTQRLTSIEFIPAAGDAPPMVKAGTGATMLDLLTFLQNQAGGGGAASGYAFPHVPAPGNLTVGGVLAIDAHGTAVPTADENFPASYGSMSNQIMAFDAVVSSDVAPYDYVVKTFQRGDPDAAALLTHAGRAFLTSATLQVIPNYNLRCQSTMDVLVPTLFAAPGGGDPPADSLASYLEASGRVEVIWFPFTDNPWLKVWTVAPTQPAESSLATGPYNYWFSDNIPFAISAAVSALTSGLPGTTPAFGQLSAKITKDGLALDLADLWGPSMYTLLYIKDTTLRVTANGYAIQTKRADVQQAVHDFAQKFEAMLTAYQAAGKYPINSPLEIRVTGLDDPSKVYAAPGTTPQTPSISALTYDAVAKANGWDCAIWFDVLTLPGTPDADAFYAELEAWFRGRFQEPQARLLPEWSKGWGYTADKGGWSDPDFFAAMRTAFTTDRDSATSWNGVVATLRKYDRSNLYSNRLLDTLFVES